MVTLGTVRVPDPYFVSSASPVYGTSGLIDGLLGLARGSIPPETREKGETNNDSEPFFQMMSKHHKGNVLSFSISEDSEDESYVDILETRPKSKAIKVLNLLPFDGIVGIVVRKNATDVCGKRDKNFCRVGRTRDTHTHRHHRYPPVAAPLRVEQPAQQWYWQIRRF